MTANRTLPRLFGPYVLTRELGSDPLGRTFRAGTATGKALKPFLLVRAFDGEAVDGQALLPAMETAVEYLEEVRGQAVARGAVLGVVDDVPFSGIDYVPGQTLDRVFGAPGHDAVPLPIEHALLVGEKILVALEAAKPFARATGAPHGFLVPAFVNVSNDGDTRVFGAGLGPGLLPSLRHPAARKTFGPYVAPEVAASGKPSAAGDVYSTSAIILESLTGKPLEPGQGEDALSGSVLAINGNPIPDDVLRLLAKGLAKDAGKRESDVVAFRKQLGKLLYGGPYAPSTFNLAFFVHQNFEKAIEEERRQLQAEEHLDVKPLVEAEERAAKTSARPTPPRAAPSVPTFGMAAGGTGVTFTQGGTPMPKKAGLGGVPVPAVVAGVLVAVGGGYFAVQRFSKPAPPPPAPVVVAPTPIPTLGPPPTPVLIGKDDPEFQKALQEKLKEEEKKIQERIAKEQDVAAKKRQVELQKAADEAQKAKEAEEAARAARDRADQEEAARLAREAEEARAREDAARKAAEAAIPKTKDGDLVDITQVDRQPTATKIVKPEPPPLARQRRVSGTVILRVLVNENGRAETVELVRDTNPRVGLGDVSREAVKSWEWTPATKDGKRVKTWIAVPIPFKLG